MVQKKEKKRKEKEKEKTKKRIWEEKKRQKVASKFQTCITNQLAESRNKRKQHQGQAAPSHRESKCSYTFQTVLKARERKRESKQDVVHPSK